MTLACLSINKSYSIDVLRDCSLSVAAGECVHLSGPSGGGKSTLLRVLALVEAAQSGTVVHGDRRYDVSNSYRGPIHPFLTLVFQQLFLWPNLTMQANLALPLYGDPRATLDQRAFELLQRFDIAHVLASRPHECSLGQRQRLALARAILADTSFLLLDEPTSALDRANAAILVAELQLSKRRGQGIVVVSHDEALFADIADRWFVVENGLLVPHH